MKVTKTELRKILIDKLSSYTTQTWLVPAMVDEVLKILKEVKAYGKSK